MGSAEFDVEGSEGPKDKRLLPLARAIDVYLTSLAHARGHDERAFEQLRSALRDLREEWVGAEMIPRELAEYVVGLAFFIDGIADQYRGEDAEAIHLAAIELDGLTLRLVEPLGEPAAERGQTAGPSGGAT